MLNFSALQTPANNGQTLIEPPPQALAGASETNQARFSTHALSVLDLDAATLRQRTRAEMGFGACGPLIVIGHQPEWIHAGVWAKFVVASRLARALDGVALNLIVDHDVPRDGALTIAGQREKRTVVDQVEAPGFLPGLAYELMPAWNADDLDRLRRQVREGMGETRFEASGMPTFFKGAAACKNPAGIVEQMAAGRRAIEKPFGVHVDEYRVSRFWPNPLVAHIVLDARRFAEAYNTALADYRRRHRVRGANRPIPDLIVEPDAVEVPFWVCGPEEPRSRLFVRADGARIEFLANSTRGPLVGSLDRATLARGDSAVSALDTLAPLRIRPRALTLTLWARLFLADLFIHGIGGAKYDRITDAIIRQYFGVEAPEMACVSATLCLPTAHDTVTVDDVRLARRRQRDARYNPQRYVQLTGNASTLLARREEAIRNSRELRRQNPHDHERRNSVFREIRNLNAAMLAEDPTAVEALSQARRDVEIKLAAARALMSRELFIGLFPPASLERLCDALPTVDELKTDRNRNSRGETVADPCCGV